MAVSRLEICPARRRALERATQWALLPALHVGGAVRRGVPHLILSHLQSHCEPPSYRPMHHEDFKEDLKKFRTKSRTWAGEKSKREMYSRLKKL